jgi:hypothetical protein
VLTKLKFYLEDMEKESHSRIIQGGILGSLRFLSLLVVGQVYCLSLVLYLQNQQWPVKLF